MGHIFFEMRNVGSEWELSLLGGTRAVGRPVLPMIWTHQCCFPTFKSVLVLSGDHRVQRVRGNSNDFPANLSFAEKIIVIMAICNIDMII